MEQSRNVRYDSLNTLKGLACIGVILMHCVFPGVFGKTIQYLFKFAVPCFFMISGFFLAGANSEVERHNIRRQIPKILRILLFAFCFYGVVTLVMNTLGSEDFDAGVWLSYIFRPAILPRKLLIGTFFNGTMWYLYSLIWGYLFLGLLSRWIPIRRMLWMAPLLLCLHILLRVYIKGLGLEWYDPTFFRSFLLYSIPFLLTGYWISVGRQAILQLKHDWPFVLTALVGLALQFAEYELYHQSLDFYFSTILYSLALFALAIRHPHTKVSRTLCYIGRRLSMPIYVIHVFVIRLLVLTDLSLWLRPVLAILFSMALAYLWQRLTHTTHRRTATSPTNQ